MLWPRRVWWTAGDVHRSITSLEPAACPSCGAELATPAERHVGGIAYCNTCSLAHERHQRAAVALAALGLSAGVVLGLAFPLLWPHAGPGVHLLVSELAALLPIAGLGSFSETVPFWGSPPRVFSIGPLGAISERRELLARLATTGGRCRAFWLPPLAYRVAFWTVPASVLVVTLAAYGWHHPRLWVLNLAPERVTFVVDGAVQANVAPAGAGPEGGAVALRLPSGRHALEVRGGAGRVLGAAEVVLRRGRDHLYAPGGAGQCFWLETTGYGKAASASPQPLTSPNLFFTLESDVDRWFSENPPPSAHDRRSTGGTLTALRHSSCAEAPDVVRRAASAAGP